MIPSIPDFKNLPLRDEGIGQGRWWFVEIVGFWTPEYLANKLALLKRARVANLVLCIDADRNVGDGDLGSSVAVVRYRRRIDAAKVLEVVASAKART